MTRTHCQRWQVLCLIAVSNEGGVSGPVGLWWPRGGAWLRAVPASGVGGGLQLGRDMVPSLGRRSSRSVCGEFGLVHWAKGVRGVGGRHRAPLGTTRLSRGAVETRQGLAD